MKRFKSIDIFRGTCMVWMFLGHLFDLWIKPEHFLLSPFLHNLFDSIGASGFLFIAGVSIQLSYRKKSHQKTNSFKNDYILTRNTYYFRAFFILIIALIYNTAIAISINNISWIWTWFVLFTVSVSLFLGWPLLKTKKWVRISIGFSIWVLHRYLFAFLILFKDQNNLYGILYHLFYNHMSQDAILLFFPFFLFGTVIGDLLSEIFIKNNEMNKNKLIKSKFIFPLIPFGISLILFGIFFDFPIFFLRGSFSWLFYSLGIEILFLVILLYFEEVIEFNPKKSYKFLFYFSYYSFTVYLGHNVLFFVFLKSLDLFSIWIWVALTFIITGLLLRFFYKHFKEKASLKIQISRLSLYMALKLQNKKRTKDIDKI